MEFAQINKRWCTCFHVGHNASDMKASSFLNSASLKLTDVYFKL